MKVKKFREELARIKMHGYLVKSQNFSCVAGANEIILALADKRQEMLREVSLPVKKIVFCGKKSLTQGAEMCKMRLCLAKNQETRVLTGIMPLKNFEGGLKWQTIKTI